MRTKNKWIIISLVLAILMSIIGCATPTPQTIEKQVTQVVKETVIVPGATKIVEKQITAVAPTTVPAKKAKYIFLFIGDGMAAAQRNAAELYLAATVGQGKRPEESKLLMNTFPAQGMNTTYDLTSVVPDSASTATALASGHKTASGVIGMDPSGKTSYEFISEVAKAHGWKIGIISTVSLDHATPAAFYAHEPSRKNMYNISMQLANSGFDYFAGGQMLKTTGKDGDPKVLDVAKTNGYTIASTNVEFRALKAGVGKVIATNQLVDEDAAMYYTIDQPQDYLTLADYVEKGIELLDNDTGFFMMVEGGKIDWAAHANDAASTILDTLAFDQAIAKAFEFYKAHPDETLIVVTGDHETGGMTIGYAGTAYSSFVDKIQNQKMSYIEFGKKLDAYRKEHTVADAKLEDVLPLIEQAFGLYVMPADHRTELETLVAAGKAKDATAEAKKAGKTAETELKYSMALTDAELAVLQEAFGLSMLAATERPTDDQTYLLYGGYEPLAIKLTTILNQKAGIAWTSYSHTGIPVQTSAIGVGSEQFNGYYDQTDIHTSMMSAAGF